MIKYNYIVIEKNSIHKTKVFTSIWAFKKFFKWSVNDIKELEKELLKLKKNDYKKDFDIYISFHAKNGYKYDLRILKKEVNNY